MNFRLRLFPWCLAAGLGLATPGLAQSNDSTDSVKVIQSTLREWIDVEKQISSEYNDWLFEKELLEQAISLLQRERETLDAAIAAAEETTSVAETRRLELLESRDALDAATGALAERVGGYEEKLLSMVDLFPGPLVDEITPLLRRIPDDPNETSLALTVRLQNIVGIMNAVDKFNNGVTSVEEIRTINTGSGSREAQVTTIYLGLAVAYFVDALGEYSGYGVPGSDSWEWTVDPELAPEISEAVAIAKGEAQASFISLPVAIAD